MTKVVYTSEADRFRWGQVLPWRILAELLRHKHLIATITEREFRATYQASHLGLAWQVMLPVIMLSIFYFVFGQILGGRFSPNTTETPVDFALALFVGLGFFNFVSQNIGTAPSLITSNVTYVKSLSFPLEVLSVTSVLSASVSLLVGLLLTCVVFLAAHQQLHASTVVLPLYVGFTVLIALGLSWGLSSLAVFVRDVSAVTTPLTLILMFMCPIFYPASMVPKKIEWVIHLNPLAVIIEDARACLLYGVWPSVLSLATLFAVSTVVATVGYVFFVRTKASFADVM
ncbi:MAG: ABC transporter permease [Burkholderiales bacterium]